MMYRDKIYHFIAGVAISVGMYYGTHNDAIALVTVLLIGVGKEVYDKYVKNTRFDFFDLLATVIGGMSAIITILAIKG